MTRRLSRRRFLGAGLASAGLIALQACGGGRSSGGASVEFITADAADPLTPTPTTGPPPTPTPGPAARNPDCADTFSFVNKQRYFPEGCVPPDLTEIDHALIDPALEPWNFPQYMRGDAYVALVNLLRAAAEAQQTMVVVSAYRSYEEQALVYQGYVESVGQEQADRQSAKPGHSEHQLGTTVDLSVLNVPLDEFGATTQATWLAANAADYGFVISYPSVAAEAETGYMYEPWHIRWIGKEAAQRVKASGLTLTRYFQLNHPLPADGAASGPAIPAGG
jgi:D-alanyl-D-alanine carboxypeptidase